MTSYNDNASRQKIIMKHYSKPNNFVKKLDNATIIKSKLCIDELHLKLKWDRDVLKSAQFFGVGCAIFISSTDIMLDTIANKTKEEIKNINKSYYSMIVDGTKKDDIDIGKLIVFKNVNKHLNRLHCAEMIYLGLTEELNK